MQPVSHQIMRLLTKSKTWDLELWSDHCPNLIFPNTRVAPIDAAQLHTVGNKGGRPRKEVVSIVQKADKAKMLRCRWHWQRVSGGKLPKSSKEETTHWSSGDVSSKTPTWRQILERCLIVLGKIAFRVFSFLSEFHMLASKRITFCACWRKEEMHSFLLLGLSHCHRSV